MANKASLNVFKNPLAFLSSTPMTGFTRTGHCEVPASDYGNHSVAAEVSEEFLDFTASQGNDLRMAGLKGGCKWCLCASRWKEAVEAAGRDPRGERIVPRVFLNATNARALEKVELEELKRWAVKE
ncbi:MAG: hypothetical protein M1828_005930 [Chrysothrix sp. TS-e1954]|nr:MAG: hypothetical protein M1828_005930 [Chrysothrix sp. TS-e1954]